jgi:hypothetical protein
MVLAVALLAYLLDAANLKIIRWFEGYPLLNVLPFNWLRTRDAEFVKYAVFDIWRLERLAVRLERQIKRAKGEEQQALLTQLDVLTSRRSGIIDRISDRYPEDPECVLPTPLGNVIAASEYYPYKLFRMDTVTLWPFLIPILTKQDYAQYVVRCKAVMDFLLNLTLVLALFGAIMGLTDWYYLGWSVGLAVRLALVTATGTLMFVLAIQGAAAWGATVRAGLVLFREELRDALHLRSPHDFGDERELWSDVSAFLGAQDSDQAQAEYGISIFKDTYEKRKAARRRTHGKQGQKKPGVADIASPHIRHRTTPARQKAQQAP